MNNAYTHSPTLHPNLILGSLEILFWLFFRPTAWRNYCERIQQQGLWKNPAFRRLLIQGYIILPLLAYGVIVFVLWGLGKPLETVAWIVAIGVAFGVAFGVVIGVAFGVVIGVVMGVASGVALGVAFGVASGVTYGVAIGVAGSVALGVFWGMVGVAFGVVYGVALGVAFIIFWLRSILFYPLFSFWHTFIYRLDRQRVGKKPSLLRYHAAFWDEYQFLPLLGLEKHLLLVLNNNLQEGQAALNYLSVTPQKWAVQIAQIEFNLLKLNRCQDINALNQIHQRLGFSYIDDAINKIFSQFQQIS